MLTILVVITLKYVFLTYQPAFKLLFVIYLGKGLGAVC